MTENTSVDVTIQKAKPEDEGAIELLMAAYSLNIDGLMVEDFFVADMSGRIVGAVCLDAGKLPSLHSIAVHPDYCGKRIGSKLLESLVLSMDDEDFLFVRTTLPVFFEKTGFIRLVDSKKKELWNDCADCARFNNCKQSVLRLEIKKKVI